MAAAVAATFELRFGAKRPKIIVAEPSLAACLFATAKTGAPVTIEGDLATLMAGLAAGEVSPLAWTVLRSVADGFVYVPDGDVPPLMRRLAAPTGGDPAVEAGESALCGLAAALRIAGEAEAAAAFQLDAASEVLIFGSEGATAPTLYAEFVSAA